MVTLLVCAALVSGLLTVDGRSAATGDGRLTDDLRGASHWGASAVRTSVNRPYVFGGIDLCVDSNDQVVLTSVQPLKESGGFVVQAFASRRTSGSTGVRIGQTQGTLAGLSRGVGEDSDYAAGLDPSLPQIVTGGCEDASAHSELAVQVARTRATSAVASGLVVNYRRLDGRGKPRAASSFTIAGATLVLCAPGDYTTYGCS